VNRQQTVNQIDVLLVEDDEEDYLLTKDLLSRLDGVRYQIHWVSDYQSALRAAKEGGHDVYLVDYRLGTEDGIELIRELVANRPDVPVVVVTGQGNHDLDLKAAQAGAVDYLVKGELSPALLERTIRYAMRGRADLQALRGLVAIVEASDDAMISTRFDGTVISWNRGAEGVYGYEASEIVGRPISVLCDSEGWTEMKQLFGSVGRGERINQLDAVRLRKDGSVVNVSASMSPILGHDEAPVAAAIVSRDVSERVRAMEKHERLAQELRQSQKMEAIGRLASGIAHDFNNLLTVISGYTQLLLCRSGPAGERDEELRQISKAADQAARLTGQLLAYSRKQVLELRALDLNEIVAETATMLSRTIAANIEISTALSEDLKNIRADTGQIEQIIINLVVNARDAMPEGGKLLVATRNVTLPDAPDFAPSDLIPGDYVLLAVTDTGRGMDAATVERIFEPFYTTKERGEGTGLGLSTVYGIVKQTGGQIHVESNPSIGTTFWLYLPQAADKAETSRPGPVDGRSLIGSETVLLVEDAQALRQVGKLILETYGYTVLLAADGAAGLRLAQDYPGPIQLLMADILMPKMGGIELAEQLTALRPALKVLYTSGYNDGASSLQRVAGSRYLQKPYAMKELAHTVRDLLDDASASKSLAT
jgi:two-component system, cell cycle sensor histidine kinase and response regulator CckA